MGELSDLLEMLRARGVARATLHADGTLASVEFAPEFVPTGTRENQNEAATTPRVTGERPASRAAGRLVPRVDDERS